MDNFYDLKIILPDKVFLEAKVKKISFKTKDGSRSILARHQAYFGSLLDGEILITISEKPKAYALFTAHILFRDNDCLILAEMAAKADEVELMLEQRRKELEQLYADGLKSDLEIQRVHMGLHRALIRNAGNKNG